MMRRPFCVTILLWLVLSLTAWSGLRLFSAIWWWSTLAEFTSPPGPFYIAASGASWLIASILLLWGLWQAKTWIRYALLGVGAAFMTWYWSDRLIFQMSSGNGPFVLLTSILVLILISACVFVPSTRTFFSEREAHDREP